MIIQTQSETYENLVNYMGKIAQANFNISNDCNSKKCDVGAILYKMKIKQTLDCGKIITI